MYTCINSEEARLHCIPAEVVNFTNEKVVMLVVGDHHHYKISEPCGKVFTTFC